MLGSLLTDPLPYVTTPEKQKSHSFEWLLKCGRLLV